MAEAKMVKMLDGREVSFGIRMKRKTETLENGAKVRFDFPTMQTLIFEVDRCDSATRDLLTAHGASQKIGDECADLDTPEECFKACDAMIQRLYAGTGFERQGGGGFQDSTLIDALTELSGKERTEVAEVVKSMSSAERTAMRQVEQVKAIIDRIDAQKSKGADVGALMGKLGL